MKRAVTSLFLSRAALASSEIGVQWPNHRKVFYHMLRWEREERMDFFMHGQKTAATSRKQGSGVLVFWPMERLAAPLGATGVYWTTLHEGLEALEG